MSSPPSMAIPPALQPSHSLSKLTKHIDLLESFPLPPSHIPHSPHGPPPSLPPSIPLPPLPPGPSPLSERDTILFIASTHSRRSSRLSISSRLSSHSIRSNSSCATYPFDSISHRNSTGSNDVDLPPSITRRKHSMPTLDEQDCNIAPTNHDESIASIDMRDLPDDDDPPAYSPSSTSPPYKSTPFTTPARPKQQYRSKSDRHVLPRATSPDIAEILSTTPRPRRRSSSSRLSHTSTRISRSSTHSTPDLGLVTKSGMRKRSFDAISSIDAVLEAKLDNAFKGDDGHESDSSIDLQTPLPNLMLRHGLLSSNSRLLPPRSHSFKERPISIASLATDYSALPKDERDTPKRRTRHRDGQLLRGGVGLTTGLGWSDSEDEDAPSPLTRRLSSLTLARRSSPSSIRSARHPLSRSISSSILRESTELPYLRTVPTRQTQMEPSVIGASPHSAPSCVLSMPNPRASASSAMSTSPALALTIPNSAYAATPTQIAFHTASDDSTPSSGSSLSLPVPTTPESMHNGPKVVGSNNGVKVGKERINFMESLDTDKVLPPLPLSRGPKKYASNLALGTTAAAPRPRTYSSTSSGPSGGAGANIGSGVSSRVSQLAIPRPLKLAQTHPQNPLQPGEQFQKPGQVLVYNRNLHDQQRSAVNSVSSMPSSTTPSPITTSRISPTGINNPRAKPRTGTGMMYRNSSLNILNTVNNSRIRLPSAIQSPALLPSSSPSSLRAPSPAFRKVTPNGSGYVKVAIPRTVAL